MSCFKIYPSGFIGHTIQYHTPNFCYISEEENYKKACITQPNDWIYRNYPITYQYNSNGHRSKELDELSNDYVIFTGCSLTDGHGLKYEDTYAYLVAKALNTDFYNLGLKGGSIDTCFFNLVTFLSKVKVLPKIVFLQYPAPERFGLSNTQVYNVFSAGSVNDLYDKEVYYNLLKYDAVTNQQLFYKEFILNYLKNMNIQVYSLGIHCQPAIVDYTIHLSKDRQDYLDFARDLDHPGIETNKAWAEKIIRKII